MVTYHVTDEAFSMLPLNVIVSLNKPNFSYWGLLVHIIKFPLVRCSTYSVVVKPLCVHWLANVSSLWHCLALFSLNKFCGVTYAIGLSVYSISYSSSDRMYKNQTFCVPFSAVMTKARYRYIIRVEHVSCNFDANFGQRSWLGMKDLC